MKKFGKIFGVVTLAFATLTAGVIGLSGCGEKWKNPKEEEPQEPPAIVTPPQERPLVGVVTLKDVEDFLNLGDVNTKFDGVKIVAEFPADGVDELTGYEFSAVVGETAADKKMILKYNFVDESSVTNYVKGDERAIYVKREAKGETLTQKIVDEEETGELLDIMNTTYENASDVKTQFAGMKAQFDAAKEFRAVAVKTTFANEVSFEITYSYKMMEEDEEGELTIEASYTGSLGIEFEDSAVQVYRTQLSRKVKGSQQTTSASASVENLVSLVLPADLDTYGEVSATEETVTLAQVDAYLKSEGVISDFAGFEMNITETGHKDISFSALKSADKFLALTKNWDSEDDLTYYLVFDFESEVGHIVVETATGTLSQIKEEEEIQNLTQRHLETYDEFSDVKLALAGLMTQIETSANVTITATKMTLGEKVEFVIGFAYDLQDEETGKTFGYSGTMTIKLAGNVVASMSVEATRRDVESDEIVSTQTIRITRIENLDEVIEIF